MSYEQDRMAHGRPPEGAQRFERAALPPVPWKNGAGTTQEVVTHPPGAAFDEFDWRASVATIGSDAPFSAFPGVDRTITLAAGLGVRLSGPEVDHTLDRVGAQFSFSGEVGLDSALLEGEVTVLNVMTRRGRCWAEVAVVQGAYELPPSGAGLLMSLRGSWRVEMDRTGQWQPMPDLAALEGLWWAGPGGVRAASPVVVDADAPAAGPLLAVVRILGL